MISPAGRASKSAASKKSKKVTKPKLMLPPHLLPPGAAEEATAALDGFDRADLLHYQDGHDQVGHQRPGDAEERGEDGGDDAHDDVALAVAGGAIEEVQQGAHCGGDEGVTEDGAAALRGDAEAIAQGGVAAAQADQRSADQRRIGEDDHGVAGEIVEEEEDDFAKAHLRAGGRRGLLGDRTQ